jgi:hypothetical protein
VISPASDQEIETMDLQDLKERWADYDRKLDASLRLNTRVLREVGLNKVDSALKRLSRGIWLELLTSFAVVVALGMFMASHRGELRFLAPALALGLFAVSLVISSIHQLEALSRIDYSGSVVAIQRTLARLRIERIRMTKWALLLSPLLWVPGLIVSLEGILGVDAYVFLDTAWIVANLLFGVAFIPLMLWVSRRVADRWQGSPFLRSLLDDLAGHSLSAATGFLGALSEFEAEER